MGAQESKTWVGQALACLSIAAALTLSACSSDPDEENSGGGNANQGDGDQGGDGDGDASDGSATGGAASTPGSGGQSSSSGGAGTEPEPGCQVDLECDPTPLPSTGDFAQDCVDRINQFRVGCHCLPALERWTEAEACATANAEGDQASGVAHSSWGSNGVCSEDSGELAKEYNGGATNECPGWGSKEDVINGCLKSMYGEGKQWEEAKGSAPTQADYENCPFDTCYVKYGHFIAMTKASHTKVACGVTSSGKVWSVQNFK